MTPRPGRRLSGAIASLAAAALASVLTAVPSAAALAPPAPALAPPPPDSGRFAIELRAGGAIGQVMAAASAVDRLPGPAWRVGASLALNRFADVTIGYGSSGFGCRTGFCQENRVTFTGTGPDAGVRVHGRNVWARVGVVRHALRSTWSAQAGPGSATADAAFGWEAGAGVAFDVGRSLQLTPGLRYATYRAAFDGGPADAVGYVTGDIGVRVAVR